MREQDYSLIAQIFVECLLDAPCTIPGPGNAKMNVPSFEAEKLQARQVGI